jgi:tetratricopeptide (TPR) repeat protein
MVIISNSSLPALFVYLTALLAVFCCAVASDSTNAASEQKVVASLDVALNPNVGKDKGVDKEVDSKGEKPKCQEWAAEGECHRNPRYMLENCAASCNQSRKATAVVYEGEDVGVAAFRFAEEYSATIDSDTESHEIVMQVARQLQDLLEAQNYEPPKELTHCGKRQCSAGKLWKRAEEMRKADMHDDAGADLIRALLKTGIEVDFIDRCKRSLQWAFGSIQRQREREKREAIEEAKLEARKEEERAAMAEALERKKEYEADFLKFGGKIQESIANADSTASVGADGTVEMEQEVKDLIVNVKKSFVEAGPQGGNWSETLQLTKKMRPSDKSTDILLIEARCHEMLGDHKSALSTAGRLIQKAASYTSWINDSPRMMAVTLGANAAMQLGLSDNALSFYQTVLKFDPEQEKTRKQYRGLKKVVKLMGKADEQIEKGYNKAASVHVEDCLSAMRGLDVDSPLFRSKIQLKQCTILSGMGKYEEALNNCDSAVEQREGNDSVSDESKKEAYLVRGEALLLDMDYDEAVQDFRAAFDLVPEDKENMEEKRELNHKLQQTKRQQELWNGGVKDMRFNENTGYPDGRPPERDHAKILQLPIDLEERSKEIKCAWLKKQFKTLVRKYHPDKYKGNKKRAARKFKEVKEAKEIISKAWNC